MTTSHLTRRTLLGGAGAAMIVPATARAQTAQTPATPATPATRRNISSFVTQDWRDHFDSLGKASIVADTRSRALHFWSGNGETYLVFPTSVPKTDELTKRGYTRIVRKKIGPSWTPTASQLKRFPDWKPVPPGPDNPLGTHAMYLGWPAYIIHGTHDTRKIGRRSSDGCIGLYNESIARLFDIAPVGTQVRLI